MDEKMGDRWTARSRDALLSTGGDSVASFSEYQMRLRSTERIRLIVMSQSPRVSAPQHLVVRIRESLSVEQIVRPTTLSSE